MRLAWFSPLAPVRSGISAYSVEALERFAGAPPDPTLPWPSQVDVFVDALVWRAGRGHRPPAWPAAARVRPAHEFLPAHRRAPYDLVVYHLGNAMCHDYMWPYLLEYPGLVVLHDGELHHARARLLLSRGRKAAYRAELAAEHPTAPAALAAFAVDAGLGSSLYYLWPMRQRPIDAARAVAVHNPRLAADLASEHAGTPVVTLPMGVRDVVPGRPSSLPARVRAWIEAGDGPLFAAFGLVTPEKRVPETLEALAGLRDAAPRAKLLLVGNTAAHYDAALDIARLGLDQQVAVTGWVDDADLDGWTSLADVCLCLRWPTARETSASWLRCLAAGRPTVVTDLADLIDVPTLDPRSWTLMTAPTRAADVVTPPDWRRAVAVAVDILDEQHSLGLALGRLASDASLRRLLGVNARQWWQAHHTLDHQARGYQEAFATALEAPRRRGHRAPHADEDGGRHARTLLEPFGLCPDFLR